MCMLFSNMFNGFVQNFGKYFSVHHPRVRYPFPVCLHCSSSLLTKILLPTFAHFKWYTHLDDPYKDSTSWDCSRSWLTVQYWDWADISLVTYKHELKTDLSKMSTNHTYEGTWQNYVLRIPRVRHREQELGPCQPRFLKLFQVKVVSLATNHKKVCTLCDTLEV